MQISVDLEIRTGRSEEKDASSVNSFLRACSWLTSLTFATFVFLFRLSHIRKKCSASVNPTSFISVDLRKKVRNWRKKKSSVCNFKWKLNLCRKRSWSATCKRNRSWGLNWKCWNSGGRRLSRCVASELQWISDICLHISMYSIVRSVITVMNHRIP
jgi:hypothetical protein